MLSDHVAFVADFFASNPIETVVTDELNNVVVGLSLLSFVLTIAILFLYSKGDHTFLGIPATSGILFFSALVTMEVVLSKAHGKVYNIYCLVLNVVIGILLNIYGSMKFFKVPADSESPPAFKKSSISIVMLGITVPLCLMELFLVVLFAKRGFVFRPIFVFTALVQKIVQVGIYHFSLRHKDPDDNRHHGASLYLKIMAVFNFFMWLQSITDGNASMKEAMKSVLPEGSSIIAAVYTALIVDYRLLCALLYTEFALEIEHLKKRANRIENASSHQIPYQAWNTVHFRVLTSQYTGLGYMLGISIFIAQFTVALQYVKSDPVGPWVNIFAILADIYVVCLGVALVRLADNAQDENSWHEAGSKGVHIMVAFMGVMGLAFWILKCALTVIFAMYISSHDESVYHYVVWHCIVYVFKIIGVLFQLYFFFRITPSIGLRVSIRKQKISYVLVPCLMLAQISIFINSVIDSYSYVVEEFVKEAKLNIVMSVAYKVGEPLYLGFCLHMFFHFFIVNINLRGRLATREHAIVKEETDDEDSDDGSLEQRLLHQDLNYRTI